jgi:hypothetical protein
MATPAHCCTQALRDATIRWPNRKRASDGIMGDAAHQQRKSDHNQGNAFDLTHDPDHGVDCNELSRLVITTHGTRVTYVIWNKVIWNNELYDSAHAGYRAYHGPNPHTKHMHVSIAASARDDLSPWPWSSAAPDEDSAGLLIGKWNVTIGDWRGVFVFDRNRSLYWANQAFDADQKHHAGSWWFPLSGGITWRFSDDPKGYQRTFFVNGGALQPSTQGQVLPEGMGFFSMVKDDGPLQRGPNP